MATPRSAREGRVRNGVWPRETRTRLLDHMFGSEVNYILTYRKFGELLPLFI